MSLLTARRILVTASTYREAQDGNETTANCNLPLTAHWFVIDSMKFGPVAQLQQAKTNLGFILPLIFIMAQHVPVAELADAKLWQSL